MKCVFSLYDKCIVIKNVMDNLEDMKEVNQLEVINMMVKDLNEFIKRYCSMCVKVYSLKQRTRWGIGVTL